MIISQQVGIIILRIKIGKYKKNNKKIKNILLNYIKFYIMDENKILLDFNQGKLDFQIKKKIIVSLVLLIRTM